MKAGHNDFGPCVPLSPLLERLLVHGERQHVLEPAPQWRKQGAQLAGNRLQPRQVHDKKVQPKRVHRMARLQAVGGIATPGEKHGDEEQDDVCCNRNLRDLANLGRAGVRRAQQACPRPAFQSQGMGLVRTQREGIAASSAPLAAPSARATTVRPT